MKKLNRVEAQWMKEMSNSIVEIDNKRYYLSVIEMSENDNKAKHSLDQDAKEKYKKIKMNILKSNDFSIDDVIEMMEEGAL